MTLQNLSIDVHTILQCKKPEEIFLKLLGFPSLVRLQEYYDKVVIERNIVYNKNSTAKALSTRKHLALEYLMVLGCRNKFDNVKHIDMDLYGDILADCPALCRSELVYRKGDFLYLVTEK